MTAAAAGLLLTLPLTLSIALLIAATLGRPVLFRQLRAGRHARPFALVKFRTMTDERDAAGRPLDDAVRTTRFGRLLRRSRLDELPGLWNLLRGDIAIIGPRPLLPETIRAMGSAGRARCAVRPGLTGWAQVNGNSLLASADKVALDLWYIENRSMRRDFAILARTLWVSIAGERLNRTELGRAHAGGDRRGG